MVQNENLGIQREDAGTLHLHLINIVGNDI